VWWPRRRRKWSSEIIIFIVKNQKYQQLNKVDGPLGDCIRFTSFYLKRNKNKQIPWRPF
jgi:hypothetical protein